MNTEKNTNPLLRLLPLLTKHKTGVLRSLLFVSLILNLTGAAILVKKLFNRLDPRNKPMVTNRPLERRAVFEGLPVDTTDVLFVGNSLTERFPLEEMLGSLKVKNRGIAGDKTGQLLARLGPIVKGQPKKIFIEIGVNDILEGVPPDTLLSNYYKIIDTIQEQSPRTAIFIQSVFPVRKKIANDLIPDVNFALKTYCSDQGLIYVDIYSALCADGRLDESLTVDGIHLNYKGYLVWHSIIKDLL